VGEEDPSGEFSRLTTRLLSATGEIIPVFTSGETSPAVTRRLSTVAVAAARELVAISWASISPVLRFATISSAKASKSEAILPVV